MCSIFFAWDCLQEYKLVVAANRDEFYARPTEPSHFHGPDSDILSGLDGQAGGSWMGITRSGKFSALTNYRDLSKINDDAPSRGDVVSSYLTSKNDPTTFYESFKKNTDNYNQFNVLFGNFSELYYHSNVRHIFQKLYPGIYGLSNHLLNTPWPKVEKGRNTLQQILNDNPSSEWIEKMFYLLEDRQKAPEQELPDTGVGFELERLLSPIFITSGEYGTRTSTVLLMRRTGEVFWVEKTFEHGKFDSLKEYDFKIHEI